LTAAVAGPWHHFAPSDASTSFALRISTTLTDRVGSWADGTSEHVQAIWSPEVEVFRVAGQGARPVVVQPQRGLEGGDQCAPFVAVFKGAGVHHDGAGRDLLAAQPGEQSGSSTLMPA
jgi:hypothetical protein